MPLQRSSSNRPSPAFVRQNTLGGSTVPIVVMASPEDPDPRNGRVACSGLVCQLLAAVHVCVRHPGSPRLVSLSGGLKSLGTCVEGGRENTTRQSEANVNTDNRSRGAQQRYGTKRTNAMTFAKHLLERTDRCWRPAKDPSTSQQRLRTHKLKHAARPAAA